AGNPNCLKRPTACIHMKPTHAAVLVLACALPSPWRDAQANGITNVQHVVIFMQENRSFDHYFGALKGVCGFGDKNALEFRNGQKDFYQPQNPGYVLPFHNSAQCIIDLDHSWDATHVAWNSGKWDKWVPVKGTTTMAYYNRSDLGYHYALADAYTICDAFF